MQGKAFTDEEKAAVEDCLAKLGLLDIASGNLTDVYNDLKPHQRPTGKTFWKMHMSDYNALAARKPDNLRKYFASRFGHLI